MEVNIKEIGERTINISGGELGEKGISAIKVDENELLISVKMDPSQYESRNLHCPPQITIMVGGVPLGVIQEAKFKASAGDLIPEMEFSVLSPDIEELKESKLIDSIKKTISELKKFLPYIRILEKDLVGNIVSLQGWNRVNSSTEDSGVTVKRTATEKV